jgi:hypothetical protein
MLIINMLEAKSSLSRLVEAMESAPSPRLSLLGMANPLPNLYR